MMSTRDSLKKSDVKANLTRIRRHAPEKFKAFIFMHLSMVLDLDGDKLETLACEKKTTSTPFSWKRSSDKLLLSPGLVKRIYVLINHLSMTESLKTDGLFRKSGNKSRQKQLRQLLESSHADRAVRKDKGLFVVHDYAHLLKTLLSELPEPLLTERHIEAHRQIAEMGAQCQNEEEQARTRERRIRAIQLLFQLLPLTNLMLLESLLLLLARVIQHPENRMTAASLGTIFAPHLLCSKKLSPTELHEASSQFAPAVAFMVENAKELFEIPEVLAMDVNEYWNKLKDTINISMDEIDSPGMAKWDSGPALTSMVKYTTHKSQEELEAISKAETERQLADLYAHVQSMPQSAEKKKLLHRFNKASQSETKKKFSRSRSIGESLMKHLRSRSKSRTRTNNSCKKSLAQELNEAEDKENRNALGRARASPSVESKIAYLHSREVEMSARNKSPVWKLQSAVHVVEMNAGERQSRSRKRRSDEELEPSRPAKAASQEEGHHCGSHGLRQPAPRVLPSVENEIHKLPRTIDLPSTENEIVHMRPQDQMQADTTPHRSSKPPRPRTFHGESPRTPQSNGYSPKTRTPLLQINSGFHESSL